MRCSMVKIVSPPTAIVMHCGKVLPFSALRFRCETRAFSLLWMVDWSRDRYIVARWLGVHHEAAAVIQRDKAPSSPQHIHTYEYIHLHLHALTQHIPTHAHLRIDVSLSHVCLQMLAVEPWLSSHPPPNLYTAQLGYIQPTAIHDARTHAHWHTPTY